MIDLTSGESSLSKPKKRKMHEDDSDIELQEDSVSQGKRRRSALPMANKDTLEGAFATWGRGDDDMEPSTKMLQMLELLKEWDSAGDKTIIYSQCSFFFIFSICAFLIDRYYFLGTSMLDLIERIFSRHGIRNLRFDGSMDRTERDHTLATFKKHGGPKVILIR
jgi:hypothetical protein